MRILYKFMRNAIFHENWPSGDPQYTNIDTKPLEIYSAKLIVTFK